MIANPTRRAFLETSRIAAELIGQPAVQQRWRDPSALEALSVGGLAAHLGRAVLTVEDYLGKAAPTPAVDTLSAPRYFASMNVTGDAGKELDAAVRKRGEDAAAAGAAEVVATVSDSLQRLAEQLALEPPTRLVSVIGERVLTLDEYLVTRLVELVIHSDDLAASVDLPPPNMPESALVSTVDCLVEVARLRSGDLAVVRALARRERDPLHALRVF